MIIRKPTIVLITGALYAGAFTAVPAYAAPQGRCLAVDVVGMTVQKARAQLVNNGCKPGSARDGSHFLINAECSTDPQEFGRVKSQSVIGRRLGMHEVLVLTKGVRTTSGGQLCSTIDQDERPHELSDLNGRYIGTLTVTASQDPDVPVGYTQGGIRFGVTNGRIAGSGGDFTWSVSGRIVWDESAGEGIARLRDGIELFIDMPEYSTQYFCSGTLTFTVGPEEHVAVTSGSLDCDSFTARFFA